VVASLSLAGMEESLARLRSAGLPYIELEPTGLGSVSANIRRLAIATGRAERGEALAAEMERRMASARERATAASPRPRVYWEWWPRPLVAAAGASWMGELIAMAGGVNVFADAETDTVKPTTEDVQARRPEVVVACWCGAKTAPRASLITGRDGWANLPAVRAGRVHVAPESLFTRPGPRLADGLDLLVDLLHPDDRTTEAPRV
jgi:iron complex transport system substrate-binding protein